MQWSTRMGWRSLSYLEHPQVLIFRIEPMSRGGDLVFIPDADAWRRLAPEWARQRAGEIVARLKSINWCRELHWRRGAATAFLETVEPMPGSIEATPRGRELEQRALFDSGSKIGHAQSRLLWHAACSDFAATMQGRVAVTERAIIRHSVFDAVELPVLRANSRVTLLFV